MVQHAMRLNKLRFLAFFSVLLVGVAVLQIFPMSAMALSTVAETDLVQISGQSGVSMGNDVTVNTVMDVVAWGDTDGPAPRRAGMQELGDAELAQVYGTGFSNFTLDTGTGIALINLPTITVSTWTEISSMKMGYYGGGWDQDWIGQGTGNVSLGTSSTDLVFKGLYIEAQFTNVTNNATRQLEYLRIGTPSLTGPVSANFNSFSGEIAGTPYTRFNLGNATITANNSAFYLSLSRASGFQFNWGAGTTKTP
jgi:hypothetical protein